MTMLLPDNLDTDCAVSILFVSGSRGLALYIRCHDVFLFELVFSVPFRFASLNWIQFMLNSSMLFYFVLLHCYYVVQAMLHIYYCLCAKCADIFRFQIGLPILVNRIYLLPINAMRQFNYIYFCFEGCHEHGRNKLHLSVHLSHLY